MYPFVGSVVRHCIGPRRGDLIGENVRPKEITSEQANKQGQLLHGVCVDGWKPVRHRSQGGYGTVADSGQVVEIDCGCYRNGLVGARRN